MSLEQQIAALVTETNGLTQEVRDQLNLIQAAVAQAELDVDAFIQAGAANFPVGPNLLKDTKKFAGFCTGLLNTIMAWDAGGIGAPWSGTWRDGADGTIDVEVVDVTDETRLTALGLWPLDELGLFVRHYPNDFGAVNFGIDNHVAILDINVTTPTTDPTHHAFQLSQSDDQWVSIEMGEFRTQTSLFASVIEADPNIEFEFVTNRTWDTPQLGAAQVGQGWKHYHASRLGFGGSDDTYIRLTSGTSGHMKVAIALPYSGFGDHQGMPLWTGSAGYWDRVDEV